MGRILLCGKLCQEINWLSVLPGSDCDQGAGKLFTGRFQWVPVKRRKIAHLDEDGGCGCEWFTVEVAEDVIGKAG